MKDDGPMTIRWLRSIRIGRHIGCFHAEAIETCLDQTEPEDRVMAATDTRQQGDDDNEPNGPAIGGLPIRQQEQDFFELVGDWFNAKRSPSVWS